MNKEERIAYLNKKHGTGQWNVWRIKSPWIRLPVAWLYSAASMLFFVVFAILLAFKGAAYGAMDGVAEVNDEWPWRDMWRASTTWRAS